MTLLQMLEYIVTVIALGLSLVAFVQPLTAVVKTLLGERLPVSYHPTIALVWGLILSLGLAMPLFALNWRQAILVGIVAAMSAAGLYDYGKSKATPVVSVTTVDKSAVTHTSGAPSVSENSSTRSETTIEAPIVSEEKNK